MYHLIAQTSHPIFGEEILLFHAGAGKSLISVGRLSVKSAMMVPISRCWRLDSQHFLGKTAVFQKLPQKNVRCLPCWEVKQRPDRSEILAPGMSTTGASRFLYASRFFRMTQIGKPWKNSRIRVENAFYSLPVNAIVFIVQTLCMWLASCGDHMIPYIWSALFLFCDLLRNILYFMNIEFCQLNGEKLARIQIHRVMSA